MNVWQCGEISCLLWLCVKSWDQKWKGSATKTTTQDSWTKLPRLMCAAYVRRRIYLVACRLRLAVCSGS